VILGLSITSSWGNGHATTYRALIRRLVERGHDVLFLERDVPWYAVNRDMPDPPFGKTRLYTSLDELKSLYGAKIRDADFVMVGSYVPDGVAVGEWVADTARGITAFYDIDTPVTLAKLRAGDHEYLTPELIPRFDIYFSFTGGPTLEMLEKRYRARLAAPLYCSVDPDLYYPERQQHRWDLGYIGTYSDDRQPVLDRLLIEPARKWDQGHFVVAGPLYPKSIQWPLNTERAEHIPPAEHRSFYNKQRFTLNVTRADMVQAGYSPSVRLFEAAACATPIISDWWDGLDSIFEVGEEILIAREPLEVLKYLREIPEEKRIEIGNKARKKVISAHTSAHRAKQLESYAYALKRRGHLG
ncbi:MAG: glycosyltransferase, partial [Syntrophobacteraceae bacterium]